MREVGWCLDIPMESMLRKEKKRKKKKNKEKKKK